LEGLKWDGLQPVWFSSSDSTKPDRLKPVLLEPKNFR
jgi:hypothetical protein